MGAIRNASRTLVGKPEGRKILKWILRKYSGRVWTGLVWLRIGTSGWLLLTL
jgi:hypothetical protein